MQWSFPVRPAVLFVLFPLVVAGSAHPLQAQTGARSPRPPSARRLPVPADPAGEETGRRAKTSSAQELSRLRQAVMDDLDNVELRRRFAAALLAAGKAYPAVDQLDEALRRDPDDPLTHQLLGACYRRLDEPDEAAGAFRRALELDPSLARSRIGLAAVLSGQGDVEGAIAQLDTVLEKEPDRFGLLLTRADLQMRTDRPERALPSLAHALELRPNDVAVRLVDQDLLVQLGRYGEARQVLESGLEQVPDDPALADALARLLAFCPGEAACDPARALELADATYRAHSTPEHAATLALSLAASGRFDEAAAIQSQLLATAQKDGAPEAVVNELKESLAAYQRKERPALPSDRSSDGPSEGR